MMAYYPYFNPYQQLPQQMIPQIPQQNSGSIIWVSSDQEAMGYLVAPNSAVTLWNSNAPVVYLKQADASGKPTMRIYDLVERTQTAPVPSQQSGKEYVSREDFDALAARVEELAARKTVNKSVEKEEKK